MQADDLRYENLIKLISPLLVKGKTQFVTFLDWFLENTYR